MSRSTSLCVSIALAAGVAACRQDMHDQARKKTFASSQFFADGRSARPQVAGTVARDDAIADDFEHTGRVDGRFVDAFPTKVTAATLARGRDRYDVYCAMCHARDGSGDGVVVRRGFPRAESFHTARMRELPAGRWFDVVSHGSGTMYDLADVTSIDDRWAITAYVRALQRSQSARLDDVPADGRTKLGAR